MRFLCGVDIREVEPMNFCRKCEERKRVPDDVMDRMGDRLEPPAFDEAHDVTWIATSDHGCYAFLSNWICKIEE